MIEGSAAAFREAPAQYWPGEEELNDASRKVHSKWDKRDDSIKSMEQNEERRIIKSFEIKGPL
jgi:hypothetical protein